MAAIAEQAEQDKMREHDLDPMIDTTDQREFLAHAAVESTRQLGVKGILTDSETGQTARALLLPRSHARHRHLLQGEDHAAAQPFLRCDPHLPEEARFGAIHLHAAVRMMRQKGFLELK